METLSEKILERLRREAAALGRPDQRNATLDRLVEACNAIADGSARAVISKGNPSAEVSFRGKATPISPPRIEDYVLARQAIDLRNNAERSAWTGPVASSLRKESDGMLAYVRARNLEKKSASARHGEKQGTEEWWRLIDDVSDESTRLRLMRELSEGSEAKKSVAALKAAVRLCSETFDIDAYLRGEKQVAAQEVPQLSSGLALTRERVRVLRNLATRLTDNVELANFDLEFDGRRVRQRVTKSALVQSDEMEVLLSFIQQ